MFVPQNDEIKSNGFVSYALEEASTQGNNNLVDTNSSAGTENNAIFDFPTFYGKVDYF